MLVINPDKAQLQTELHRMYYRHLLSGIAWFL